MDLIYREFKNNSCEAFNKKVWIQKGFGKFNMITEVHNSVCPICKKMCEDVENMGLYQGKCISIGRIKGETEEKRMEYIQKEKD